MKSRRASLFLLFCFLFIGFLSQQSRGEEIDIRIIVSGAEVYLKPSLASLVVATVPMGASLKATERREEWFRVNLPPDENGFVLAGYVRAEAAEIHTGDIGEQDQVVEAPKTEAPAEKAAALPAVRVPVAKRKKALGFSLKFWGGAGYLFGNHFNDHIQTENTTNAERTNIRVDREHALMKTASDVGVEFILNIGPRLGVGFGIGYFMAQKNSRAEFTSLVEPGELTAEYKPKITALPLILSIHYGLPLGERFRLNALAGAGFYYGKVYWGYNYEYTSPIFLTGYSRFNWNAAADALGFHGGLELEWEFMRGIGLVIGASGMKAAFGNLTGELKWEEYAEFWGHQDSGTIQDYTLWFLEEEFYGPWYPQLWLSKEMPDEWYVRNVEKARISVSRISIVVGIKIYLKK